jgi:hypothetical protein
VAQTTAKPDLLQTLLDAAKTETLQ